MTAIKLMPDERQMEIVGAVKAAVDHVAEGLTPTAAVVKAAAAIDANEHVLKAMVEAYNTSATIAHMKTAANKASGFPTADYDEAKASLFPEGDLVKAAMASDELAQPEVPDIRFEKAAFYATLGNRYCAAAGEHKGKEGRVTKYEKTDTRELSFDGDATVRRDHESCTVTLTFDGGGTATFENPEMDLEQLPSPNSSACEAVKAGAHKFALERFYGDPGDDYEVISGEHKGSHGKVQRVKTVTKESEEIVGDEQIRKDTQTSEVDLEIDGKKITFKDPLVLKRWHEPDAKCASENVRLRERDQKIANYLCWAMDVTSRFPNGFVTPEAVDADPAYQAHIRAKAKTAVERPMASLVNAGLKNVGAWKKIAAEAREEYERYRIITNESVAKIAAAFREVGRPNWTRYEEEVLALHGEDAKPILDEIFATGALGSVKCARAAGPLIDGYIDDTTDLHKHFQVIKSAAELAVGFKQDQAAAEASYERDLKSVIKAASFVIPVGNPLGAAMGLAGQLDQQIPQPSPSKPQMDPNVGIESELGKARLQTVVREMMTSDPTISAHAATDPSRIMDIIQDLSRLQPKILEMPSVLSAGVRKALEMGHVEPFEQQQLQDLGGGGKKQPPAAAAAVA